MDAEPIRPSFGGIDSVIAGHERSSLADTRQRTSHRLCGLIPENSILAALPHDVYTRLYEHFRLINFNAGTILDLRGDPFAYVIFPQSCVVSVIREMPEGASPEIGLVGSEGMVGIEFFMGGATQLNRAVVRIPGTAVRISATVLRKEFEMSGALQSLLLRFTQAYITQMAQGAVCKRLHSIEHDVCRWLLQLHDRSTTDRLPATHELIATALGVRREGVTVAIGRLHAAQLIRRTRGQITIVNRAGLEKHGCDCHRLVREQYERILGNGTQQKLWMNNQNAGVR
jgi:CRP-like cAMP-binding protein